MGPNSRRACVVRWKDFTSWCIEHRCAGLSAVTSSTWWKRRAGPWPTSDAAWLAIEVMAHNLACWTVHLLFH